MCRERRQNCITRVNRQPDESTCLHPPVCIHLLASTCLLDGAPCGCEFRFTRRVRPSRETAGAQTDGTSRDFAGTIRYHDVAASARYLRAHYLRGRAFVGSHRPPGRLGFGRLEGLQNLFQRALQRRRCCRLRGRNNVNPARRTGFTATSPKLKTGEDICA